MKAVKKISLLFFLVLYFIVFTTKNVTYADDFEDTPDSPITIAS